MLRSISKAATDLGVTRATVYNRLKNKEYGTLVVKENGKKMIDENLFNLLKNSIKIKNIEKIENVEILNDQELNLIKTKCKDTNNIFEVLLKQIEEKDIQINRLHDLIESNQILIKNSQEREKEQIKLEEHFNDIDRKLIEIRDKNNIKKNKNIFKSILNRK